ncbi:MAG: hypothetical protein AVDCRST_MAG05-890 [uncultured Rubrobacteraceae bacterium]|uniref:Uncharacterized protein n=1 Tax=uncultured Rubrobacteraceae bacterium TaxID=349277 RepID=A0A6J4RJT0_9ACTN|nr:MAG: hypothetical protein AVDCRST_MAG05-890 [uncultured Rubrobacteraceae bacterium]
MSDFVALYRGRTVAEAELIALSAEPNLVRRFFAELLGEAEMEKRRAAERPEDRHRNSALEALRDD